MIALKILKLEISNEKINLITIFTEIFAMYSHGGGNWVISLLLKMGGKQNYYVFIDETFPI